MLQCQRCQQWFHQECIRNPKIPQLLWGDRFWNFVCTLCTGTTQEIVEKLPMGWVNALHLILFNLIVTNRKEYHDLEKAIIPLFKKKLKLLQMSSNSVSNSVSVLKSSRIDQPNFLESLLKANKSKFKCGSKRSKFWTLNKVGPPPAPHTKCQKVSVIDVTFKPSSITNPKPIKKQLLQGCPRRPALKNAEVNLKNKKKMVKKKDLDSLGESSDASSFGSLDAFIPRPKDFEGENHPFKSEIEFLEPLDYFLINSKRCSKRENRRKFRSPPCSSLGSAGSSPHSSISSLSSDNLHPNVHPVTNDQVDLKWSLNSYFGANHR